MRGDISSSFNDQSGSGIAKIAAGSEVVVECAGQWRQDVHITASLLKGENPLINNDNPPYFSDGRRTLDLEPEGLVGGQLFKFTPRMEDFSVHTQVKL